MAVTLLQVLEGAEYDLTTYTDALWLLSRQQEYEDLIEQAEACVEAYNE